MQGERLQREQRSQLIEIDHAHQLLLGQRWVLQPPARAEQALFLRRPRGEQHRSGKALAAPPFRQPREQCDIAGIIERAIVQPIAVHRFAKAIAIDMGAEQHHLAGLALVGAGQQADHLLAGEAALHSGQLCREAARKIKSLQIAVIGRFGQQGGGQSPGAGHQPFQRCPVQPELRQAAGNIAW